MSRLFDGAPLAARGVALRAASPDDKAFQRALFETARPDAAVLMAVMPAAARKPFLDQQFEFQSIHYARAYPNADRLLILAGDVPIGRMIVDRAMHEWCLVDIALLPESRGKGIGSLLLQSVLEAAAHAGAPLVSLSVEMDSPARRLYQRFGFVVVEEEVPKVAMEWRPSAAVS